MENLDEKILYLIKWLFGNIPEEKEQQILDIVKNMTEEEKIDTAYILYKKLEIKKQAFKEAYSHLKIADHLVDEYKEKKLADNWLVEMLENV